MLLLLISVWKRCNETYSGEVVGRCLLDSKPVLFTSSKHSSIYLHTSVKDSVVVKNQDGQSIKIKAGQQITFDDNEITAYCDGKICPISFWNFDYNLKNQYFVHDIAGTVFKLENKTLEDGYTAFFDFGDHTKITITNMNHSRLGTVVKFAHQDIETGQFTIKALTNSDLDSFFISSPVILYVKSSKYVDIFFRIVVGTTIRPTQYFHVDYSKGGVDVYKNMTLIRHNDNSKMLSIPMVSQLGNCWIHMEWVTVAIFVCLVIATLICIIILIVIHLSRKREMFLEDEDSLVVMA